MFENFYKYNREKKILTVILYLTLKNQMFAYFSPKVDRRYISLMYPSYVVLIIRTRKKELYSCFHPSPLDHDPNAHIWGVVGIPSMNKWSQDHASKNTRITYFLVRHYVFGKGYILHPIKLWRSDFIVFSFNFFTHKISCITPAEWVVVVLWYIYPKLHFWLVLNLATIVSYHLG